MDLCPANKAQFSDTAQLKALGSPDKRNWLAFFSAIPRCSTQRAGIAPPHAEGDGLSGVTSDGELYAFISVPASFAGGMPVTRARNPWAMPEAST